MKTLPRRFFLANSIMIFPEGSLIAVDTETTGLYDTLGDRPFMWSFANEKEETSSIEFPVDPMTRAVLYSKRPRLYRALKEYLGEKSISKVFFNALFDVGMSEAAGVKINGKIEDLSLAVRILGLPRNYWKLKPFGKKYLKIDDDDEKALKKTVSSICARARKLGWHVRSGESEYWICRLAEKALVDGMKTLKTWKNAGRAAQIKRLKEEKTKAEDFVNKCKIYAERDALRTIIGWEAALEALNEAEQFHIYEEEMRKIWPIVKNMYDVGIRMNLREVRRGLQKSSKNAKRALRKIQQKTWPEFNPNSYPDKFKYFIEKKKMNPLKYTKGGKKQEPRPSLDKYFFEFYDASDEVCALINEHSVNIKASSTYFESFLEQQTNKILRYRMSQIGTVTGRFSGWLQTIPKRAKEGSIMLDVRKCFKPRPGHIWYCGDYQQIEARIFADEFEEETMIEAFAAGRDVYVELRDAIENETGVDLPRQIAKNMFLGKLYGLGKMKLIRAIRDASSIEISDKEAKDILGAFDETFPIVNQAMRITERIGRQQGYVENRYGQRVPVDADFAYRGVNYIIQPTAARLMKRAMHKCHEYLKKHRVGNILLQIHDELVFELSLECDHEHHARELKLLMEDNDEMFPYVETLVDMDVCRKNWLDRKKIEL